MVLLQVIPDRGAPSEIHVRSFPFRVGRSGSNDLQIADRGIWAEHIALDLNLTEKEIVLSASTEALCFVNGTRTVRHNLRGGDVIQIGACRIIFNLSPSPQGALRLRQAFAWALTVLVVAAQAALVVFLNF